jgi:hypothetical protein
VLGLSRAAMSSGAPFKPGDQIIIKVANMQVTGHRSSEYIAINALVFPTVLSIGNSRSFQLRNVPGFRGWKLQLLLTFKVLTGSWQRC